MSYVELDGASNVRDLGGLRLESGGFTRRGLIYRGDALDGLSTTDDKTLFVTLGISLIVDLRSPEEIDSVPPRPPGVHTLLAPLLGSGRLGREPFPAGKPDQLALVYLENLERGASVAVNALEAIADQVSVKAPTIIHCAAGRDRTGVLAGVLLQLVGVERPDIVEDYVASNNHASQVTEKLRDNPLYAQGQASVDESTLLLQGETMTNFLDLVDKKHLGAENFLRERGLSQSAILSLRQNFAGHPLTSGRD